MPFADKPVHFDISGRSWALSVSVHDLAPHLRPIDAPDVQAPGIWVQLLRYRSRWRPVQYLRVIRFIDP